MASIKYIVVTKYFRTAGHGDIDTGERGYFGPFTSRQSAEQTAKSFEVTDPDEDMVVAEIQPLWKVKGAI